MKFQESVLAHSFLDHKRGIEIGPSAHNPFGLKTISVGRSTEGTPYASEEMRLCGEVSQIHVVCEGDRLTLPNDYFDFVIASHVLEHFYDPIATLEEWFRVVVPGGLIFVIFPHKDRTFDKDKPRTTLKELLDRHANPPSTKTEVADDHHTIWIMEDALELFAHLKWRVLQHQDPDDKVGNGFTFILQKQG